MPTLAKHTVNDPRFMRLGINVGTIAHMLGRELTEVKDMINRNDPVIEVVLKAYAFDRLATEEGLFSRNVKHIRRLVEDRVYAARAKGVPTND